MPLEGAEKPADESESNREAYSYMRDNHIVYDQIKSIDVPMHSVYYYRLRYENILRAKKVIRHYTYPKVARWKAYWALVYLLLPVILIALLVAILAFSSRSTPSRSTEGSQSDDLEVVGIRTSPTTGTGVSVSVPVLAGLAVPATIRVSSRNPQTHNAPEPVIYQASISNPQAVERQLREVAAHFGINADQFVEVARCESGLRPNAIGDHGSSVGVLQMKLPTFRANALRYFGYDVGDMRSDVMASAVVSAWMWQRGQAYQWTCARTLGYA